MKYQSCLVVDAVALVSIFFASRQGKPLRGAGQAILFNDFFIFILSVLLVVFLREEVWRNGGKNKPNASCPLPTPKQHPQHPTQQIRRPKINVVMRPHAADATVPPMPMPIAYCPCISDNFLPHIDIVLAKLVTRFCRRRRRFPRQHHWLDLLPSPINGRSSSTNVFYQRFMRYCQSKHQPPRAFIFIRRQKFQGQGKHSA